MIISGGVGQSAIHFSYWAITDIDYVVSKNSNNRIFCQSGSSAMGKLGCCSISTNRNTYGKYIINLGNVMLATSSKCN